MTEITYKKSTAREYFESLVITVILALFGTTFIVQAFKIPTPSMEDNLLVGDHLLVNKFVFGAMGSFLDKLLPFKTIHRGDVIVFKYPRDLSKHYVKRVIGLPGDRLKMVDKQIYINGQPLTENYTNYRRRPGEYLDAFHQQFPPIPGKRMAGIEDDWYVNYVQGDEIVVPQGHYFAMGDNRDNSSDSRYWGFVPRQNIVGKGLIIYWSYETPPEEQYGIDPGNAAQVKDLATNFFGKTRWSRTFKVIR